MNIIIAIIIFSALVLFHELGHFLLAKKNHIHVYEFCLGLGPTLFGVTKGETKYSIKLFPFGGACVMGEDEEFDSDDPKAFNNKSVWARMAVVVAGPVFNFILAFILAVIVIAIAGYDDPYVVTVIDGSPAAEAGLMPGDRLIEMNGMRLHLSREVSLETNLHPEEELSLVYERTDEAGNVTVQECTVTPYLRNAYQVGVYLGETGAEITDFTENAPAEQAGAQVGDRIVSINGTAITQSGEVSREVQKSEGAEMEIRLQRGDEEVTIRVTPTASSGYYSGFEMDSNLRTRGNVLEVLEYSFYEVKYWVVTTFRTIGMLVTGQVSFNDLSGPVGIVDTIGTAYEQSKESGAKYVWLNMLNMSILLSANLGVMNLLPIPALDGGRLLFFIIEAVRGKRISEKKEAMVHLIGFALLMVLMVAVLFNDIRKIFF